MWPSIAFVHTSQTVLCTNVFIVHIFFIVVFQVLWQKQISEIMFFPSTCLLVADVTRMVSQQDISGLDTLFLFFVFSLLFSCLLSKIQVKSSIHGKDLNVMFFFSLDLLTAVYVV